MKTNSNSSDSTQQSFLFPNLFDQLNPKDPLLALSKQLPWQEWEKQFSSFYSAKGRPAKPLRVMCGLLLLKALYNLSDEKVVELWRQNPYFQVFCGQSTFQMEVPCDAS